jgi:hypothetical protein
MLVAAVVFLFLSRSLPSNGSTCHNGTLCDYELCSRLSWLIETCAVRVYWNLKGSFYEKQYLAQRKLKSQFCLSESLVILRCYKSGRTLETEEGLSTLVCNRVGFEFRSPVLVC